MGFDPSTFVRDDGGAEAFDPSTFVRDDGGAEAFDPSTFVREEEPGLMSRAWEAVKAAPKAFEAAGQAVDLLKGVGGLGDLRATVREANRPDWEPRAKRAYEFFVGKGLAPHQAAGVVGNLIEESGLRTDAVGDSGSAHGLAQWRLDRKSGLDQFAAARGADSKDFDTQLEYVWHELNGPERKALDALGAAKNADEAATGLSRGALPVGKLEGLGPHTEGVDPRLLEAVGAAALESPYRVRVTGKGGMDARPGRPGSQHPKGRALDVSLIDRETGQPLPNIRDAQSFRAYEEFAQAVHQNLARLYPGLEQHHRFGGYFGDVEMDAMHNDLGGLDGLGMAGGSWDGGLNEGLRKRYPGVVSVGLKPPEQGSWLSRQGRYLAADAKIAWENLAGAFEGQRAAKYGDLLAKMEAEHSPAEIAADPDLAAVHGRTLQRYNDLIASSRQRGEDVLRLLQDARPAMRTFLQEGGDWSEQLHNLGTALTEDPAGVVADLGIQSGPTMAAMIAASVVAARSGLPPVAALAAGGGTSAWMQFGGEYTDRINRGQTHDQAYKHALLKSGVVGLFDAASLHTAGRVMGHVAERGLFKSAGEVAKNLGEQAALGGGGEAWGSYAAGEMPEVRDIGAEMVGELAGAPFEMGGAKLSGLDRLGQALERDVARGEVPGSADAAARAALDPSRNQPPLAPPYQGGKSAAGRDGAGPVTVDLGSGSAMVDPNTGEILPVGGANEGGLAQARPAVDSAALAGLSDEDRAAVEAIQSEPEREPVPTGLAAAVPRVRPMDPAEYAKAKKPDDLDNEGRPFESQEAALKVARGRNLAGHYPAQVRRGFDAWVLRPNKGSNENGKGRQNATGLAAAIAGNEAAPTSGKDGGLGAVQAALADAPPVPSGQAVPGVSANVGGGQGGGESPRLVTRPDGMEDRDYYREFVVFQSEHSQSGKWLVREPGVGGNGSGSFLDQLMPKTDVPKSFASKAAAMDAVDAYYEHQRSIRGLDYKAPARPAWRDVKASGPQGGQAARGGKKNGVNGTAGTSEDIATQQAGGATVGTPQPAMNADSQKPTEQLDVSVDVAAHEAATSPMNERPNPTDGQKEAGNYKKGHVRVGGLDISVENPVGSERSGMDKGGKPWSVTMRHHYGYVRGSVGRDKDHVDVFVKPGTPEDYAGPVFVVDQVDPATGRFDEHKAMVGFSSEGEARAAYQANYAEGWQGAKHVVPMGWEAFKAWVKNPNATRRPAAKAVAPIGPQSGQDGIPAQDTGTVAPVDGAAQRQEEIRFALDLADEARLYASVEEIRGLMAAPGATLEGVIAELQRIIDDGRANEATVGGVRPQNPAPADETGGIEPVAAKPARPAPPRGGSQPDNAGDRNDAAQAVADRTREPERQRDGAAMNQPTGAGDAATNEGQSAQPDEPGKPAAVSAAGAAGEEAVVEKAANPNPSAGDAAGNGGETAQAAKTPLAVGQTENKGKEPADEGRQEDTAEVKKARADLEDALKDLGQVFLDSGLFSRKAVPSPEIDEAKLMPVLARVLDASFRLGYHTFKDAARYALETIRERFGDAPADAITLDHLQGAYIAMAGKYQGKGADHKRDVVAVESLGEVMADAPAGGGGANRSDKTDRPDVENAGEAVQPVAETVTEEAAPEAAPEPAPAASEARQEVDPFKEGDRVTIASHHNDQIAGRHGVVVNKQVSKFLVSVLEPGVGKSSTREERRVDYEIRTDGGLVIHAGAGQLQAEQGEAPTAVPDVLVDGKHENPATVWGNIGYYEKRAVDAQQAGFRAKKAERKQELADAAKEHSDKAAALRAAFEAWAKASPEAAAKASGGAWSAGAKVAPVIDENPKFAGPLETSLRGKPVFTVGLKARVGGEEFARLRAAAAKYRGAWDKRGQAFVFEDRDNAVAFMRGDKPMLTPETLAPNEVRPDPEHYYVYRKEGGAWAYQVRQRGEPDNGRWTPVKPAPEFLAQLEAAVGPQSGQDGIPTQSAGTMTLKQEQPNVQPENIPEYPRPETGNGGADRGDERTSQPNRGSVGGGLAEGNEGAGSQRPTAGGAQGASGAGGASAAVRGGESVGGGDRVEPTVRHRPEAPDAPASEPVDHAIEDADQIGAGGQKTKYRQNVAAIRLVKQLEADNRMATPDEQKTLAKYVGWGGLKQAFDPNNASWSKEYAELREVLDEGEYNAARRSMLDAHYTAPEVVKAMWAGFRHLGFTGGTLLEPSIGVGNFIGLMPVDLRGKVQVQGVELDKITGAIVKQLYPKANIAAPMGFQEANIPSNSIDAAIGNPPFGQQKLYDANHPEFSNFSIHNFFFAKTLDKLRPGGIMGMVVSRYLMDAIDPTARQWLAERARLLGAVRLPYTAFLGNAGTDVVTDILYFQKLPVGAAPDAYPWWQTGEIALTHPKTGEEHKYQISRYFLDNPASVLGKPSPTGKMQHGAEYNVEPVEGVDLGGAIQARLGAEMSPDVFEPEARPMDEVVDVDGIMPDGVRVYGYFMAPDGQVMRRVPDYLDKAQAKPVPLPAQITPKRMAGLIGVRDALRALMRAELSETASAAQLDYLRGELNEVYEGFTKKFGLLNSHMNRRAFANDPDLPLLESLEPEYDPGVSAGVATRRGVAVRASSAKRADIFTKRVLQPFARATKADSAQDALIASLNERGGVDPVLMSSLYGQPWETVQKELAGLVFRNPDGGYETAEEYLSGNVKFKLERAQAVAAENPEFRENVEALERVQPVFLPADKIFVKLGSPWVPGEVVADFAKFLYGGAASAIYSPAIAKWQFVSNGGDTVALTATYGTGDWSADELIEAALNTQPVVVKKNVGTRDAPVWKVLEEETNAARAKADEVAAKFREWIWMDPERRERLETLYNERYNVTRRRTYDGSHLSLPGANPLIELRKHQKDAVWRAIQDRIVLLDHAVGAGKTWEVAAIAMELRRLGALRKPMILVPKHLIRQWRDEFYKLYPNANVLAATEVDFDAKNRKRLFARIATGDWDAVIVGHTSFKKIGMPHETERRFLVEQVHDIADAIEEMKRERGDRNVIKDMERLKEKLNERMKKLAETGAKDDTVTFDELGVDGLFVDEAHCFPAKAKVLTDAGLLEIGEIVEKRLPVNVLSVNSSTGALEWKPVTGWFKNSVTHIPVRVHYRGGAFECTANHKIWTYEEEYVEAGHLTDRHTIRLAPDWANTSASSENVSALRGGIQFQVVGAGEQRKEAFLLESMRGDMADGPAAHQRANTAWIAERPENSGETQNWDAIPSVIASDESKQSDAEPGSQGENAAFVERSDIFVSRGEWGIDTATAGGWGSARASYGARHLDGGGKRPLPKPAETLQGGFSAPRNDDGYRDRRENAQNEALEVFGQAQDGSAECARVVRVEVLERGSDGQFADGFREDQSVYCLEVEGNHNFFADGVLVSNSYKNLFFYSQMQNVAGLGSPSGSQRAFDLFIKIRYLQERFNDRGVTVFATGTPVSNSLVEMYTMQRYLMWSKMKRLGIHLLDAWAGTFGDVQNVYEVHPSGTGYRLKERFQKFANIPGLMDLYRSVADPVTMDDLKRQAEAQGKRFPVPKVKGGKPRLVVAERSEAQATFFGVPEFKRTPEGAILFKYPADLEVGRTDDGKYWVGHGGGKSRFAGPFETHQEAEDAIGPMLREPEVGYNNESILWKFENLKELTKQSEGKINALSITNEARKAGLDYRLIDPGAPDHKGSKINLAVKEIIRIHKAWEADRGAQLVFCDLSVPKSERKRLASKENEVWVREGETGLKQVKATVHAPEGFEGYVFYLVQAGKGDKKQVAVYDAISGGVVLAGASRSKEKVIEYLNAELGTRELLTSIDQLRERWGELTEDQIADWQASQEGGADEEGGDEGDDQKVSLAELLAVSGGNAGFSVYDDIKQKLIARGIPEQEIAFIHDYDTAAKKAELFAAVRKGDIRILLGSTEKMGAGMNVQERLVGLHHLDAPWRPSDLEQREGRIVRQGNKLYERDPDGFEVEILRYATKQTYDTRMWQILEHKAAGVEQLRKAGDDVLELEDIGGEAANAADMKAAASGNPLILDEIRLRNEVKSLEGQEFGHRQAVIGHQNEAKRAKGARAEGEKDKGYLLPFALAGEAHPLKKDEFAATIGGKAYTDRKEAGKAFAAVLAKLGKAFAEHQALSKVDAERGLVGVFRGVEAWVGFAKSFSGQVTMYLDIVPQGKPVTEWRWRRGLGWFDLEKEVSFNGVLTRINNDLARIRSAMAEIDDSVERAEATIPRLETLAQEPFAKAAALTEARRAHRAVVSQLAKAGGSVELTEGMREELREAVGARVRDAVVSPVPEQVDALLDDAEKRTVADELGGGDYEAGRNELLALVADALREGGRRMSAALRAIVEKVKRGVMAVAVAFNFNYAPPLVPVTPDQIKRSVVYEASRPMVDVRGAAISDDAAMVANYALRSEDGKPFIVLDKPNAMMYAFDKKGGLVGKSPAIIGASRADERPDSAYDKRGYEYTDDEKVTPAGRFTLRPLMTEHFGEALTLEGTEYLFDNNIISTFIHRTYLDGRDAAARLEALKTETPDDNRLSQSCINVPTDFYDAVIGANFSAGAPIFVLPDRGNVRQFFGWSDADVANTEERVDQVFIPGGAATKAGAGRQVVGDRLKDVRNDREGGAGSLRYSQDAPQYSKHSLLPNDAKPKGISHEQAEQAIREFRTGLSGAAGLDFRDYASLEEALGTPVHGIRGRVKGYFLPKSRTVVLIRDALDSVQDAAETLRHEVLAHYGLNLFEPAVKMDLLARIARSRHDPFMRKFFERAVHAYPELRNDEFMQAEEVFALIAEEESPQARAWLRRFMVWVVRALRTAGLWRGRVTVPELRALAQSIADGIRRGAPQRTFPASNQAQFSRDGGAEEAGSTIKSVVAELARAGFAAEANRLVKAGVLKVEHSRMAPAGVPSMVSALWDPKARQASLFYDRIAPGQVVGKFLHEMTHGPLEPYLREVIGAGAYDNLVADFGRLLERGDKWAAKAEERARRAVKNRMRDAAASYSEYQANPTEENKQAYEARLDRAAQEVEWLDEERLAYMLEEFVNATEAERRTLPGRVRVFFRNLIAAVRMAFMRSPFYQAAKRAGIDIRLTPADVAALVRTAVAWRAARASGEWQVAGGEGMRASEDGREPIPEARDAEGRLLAPNGKPSKLNAVQWRQVRTPEFKARFGDWERAAQIRHLTQGTPLAVHGDEFADFSEPLDMKALRVAARQFGGSAVAGVYVNRGSGLRLEVRASGIDQAIRHGGGPDKLKAIAAIPDLLREGVVVYDGVNPKKDYRNQYARLVVVSAPVMVSGKKYMVSAGFRDHGEGRLFYDHELWDVSRAEGLSSQPGAWPKPNDPAPTSTRLNDYYRSFVSQEVQLAGRVDENGEPLAEAIGAAGFRHSDDGPPGGRDGVPTPERGNDELSHVTAARSRSEFVRRFRELDDQASRNMLKGLARDQLADIAADLLPEIESQYLKTARLLDGDRNEIHQKGGEFLEPWGKLAREKKTRMDAANLAELMHEATLAGVDPDVDYVPVIDLKEGLAKIRKIKAGALINKALSVDDVAEIEATKRLIRQEVTRANEYARINALWDGLDAASRRAHPKEVQAIEALQKKARLTPEDRAELDRLRWMAEPSRQIYRKTRDFHEYVARETLEALIGRINATEASKDVKRELISKLRHEFEANRVAAPYFPLYRDGEYWLHYRGPGKTVRDTLVKLDKISPEMFIVTVRQGQDWPTELLKLRGSLLKGVGKAFKTEDEARVRARLGALLTEKQEFQEPGERYFEMFETAADRDEYRAQYEKAGMEFLGAGRRFEPKRSQDGVAPQFVADVEGLLRELPDSPETRGVRDAVWQLYLTTMPEPSMRKHFIHRQKRKGYMEDALRANAHKVFHDGHQLARLRHMHTLNEVLADLKENVAAAETPETYRKVEKELARLAEYQTVRSMGLNGIDAELAELNKRRDEGKTRLGAEIEKWNEFREWYRKGFNPSARQSRAMARLAAADRILAAGRGAVDRASRYIDELGDFHELLNHPESSAWAEFWNSVGFVWFLGAAVAPGVLNTFQTPMVAMPVAGARYGEAKAVAAFSRAGRQFFSKRELTLGAVLEGDELTAFHEFQRIGIIDKTLSHDMAGVAERGMDYSDFRFRSMKALTWVFHHTERLNREVTAMAVYRLARGAGRDHEAAFWDAVKLVERTHGNYEAANRAAVLRGGWARFATQFKQYAQFMTFLYLRTFRQAFKGASPEVRAEARRALAGILAMQTLVAGVHGLPFVGAQAFVAVPAAVGATWGRAAGAAVVGVELAAWLAAMALGDPDDPDDWEAELRTWLAAKAGTRAEHFIWKGAIDAFSPWAMADRASTSELWWRTADLDTEDADTIYGRIVENLGGPKLGILKNLVVGGKLVVDGLEQHNPEKVARGVETMSPNVLRYVQKAARFAKEGALTMGGDPVVENLTPAEIAGQLLGFQPSRVVSRYEVNNAIKNRKLALETRRGDIVDRVARAVRDGNGPEKESGLAAARRFNSKNPELAIDGGTIKRSVMGSAKRKANTEGGLYLAPRMRGLRERFKFGGVDE